MTDSATSAAVLVRLLEVTAREADYLGRTARRLLAQRADIDWVRSLPDNDARSELLDAFVSRYGRLQDTLLAALDGVTVLRDTQQRLAEYARQHGWHAENSVR